MEKRLSGGGPKPAVHSRARGRRGEDDACRWLQALGYRILERNVDTLAGEIDIVACEGETLCFVEVKARWNQRYGSAAAAVTASKKARLARCAALYAMEKGLDRRELRFDVLGLESTGDGWRYELIRNAFDAPRGSVV